MFSTHPKTNFNFSVAFNLLSANAFSLYLSKILSFGKEFKVAQIPDFVHDKDWKTVDGKRRKCLLPEFSLFHKMFSMSFAPIGAKARDSLAKSSSS